MSISPCRVAPASDDPLAAEDPQGVLRQILAAPVDPLLAAEDVVLAWLLRLPDDIDPAYAAGRILAVIAADPPGLPADDRLSCLLSEIARWPTDRLHHAKRRRLPMPQ